MSESSWNQVVNESYQIGEALTYAASQTVTANREEEESDHFNRLNGMKFDLN